MPKTIQETPVKKRKIKTKPEMKAKLTALRQELKKTDSILINPKGMLPNQVNKIIDLKLQLMGGIGILQWVLGDQDGA